MSKRSKYGVTVLITFVPDLHCSLTPDPDTGPTADRGPNIVTGGVLNVVSLPGLLSQEEQGHTGHDTAEERVEDAGLAEVLSIPVVETEPTE